MTTSSPRAAIDVFRLSQSLSEGPNYHSGANGDYQPVFAEEPVHELLRTAGTASGRIEWFPAHPHEGAVSACVPFATVLAQGRSTASGRRFNLAVALDGEPSPEGGGMGRALAASTFHHFADYNWDLDCGAPTFVTESPGTEIKADPHRLVVYKDYVRNIAAWLHPVTDRRARHRSPRRAPHEHRLPAELQRPRARGEGAR
jgi:hypothetical protein